MKNLLILLIFLLINIGTLESQTAQILGSHPTINNTYVSFDLATGTQTNHNPLSGVSSYTLGESTYDAINERHIMLTNLGVTVIDARTGNIIKVIANPNGLTRIEYDPVTDKIYGTYFDGQTKFGCIDLATHAFSFISTITGILSFSSGDSTFDKINGRYIVASDVGIEVIDIATGNKLTIPLGAGIRRIEYAESTNTVYGTQLINGNRMLGAIDLSTNSYSVVNTLNAINFYSTGESTFDQVNGRYFLITNFGITTIDIMTGNIIGSVPISNTLFRIEYALLSEPLPINLTSFYAEIGRDNTANILWETSMEYNCDYFVIQKSNNGHVWVDMEVISCESNSSTIRKYNTIDFSPFSGVTYYRLKQVDLDGQFDYSTIINVEIKETEIGNEILFYPNPVENVVFLKGNENEISNFKIYSVTGLDVTAVTKIVSKNYGNIEVDLQHLSSGVYFIKTQTNNLSFYKN